MKTELAIKQLKKELNKFSESVSNKTMLFIVIGIVIALTSTIFLIIKLKNKIRISSENDDFYYDEDDFYNDYYALDYEDCQE